MRRLRRARELVRPSLTVVSFALPQMRLRNLLICVITILLPTPGIPAGKSTLRNTEKHLKQYHSDRSERTLAGLFALADERMPDLIALLDSKDEGTRTEAQRIIRYSASAEGMKALADPERGRFFTGPVPVPITTADLKLFDSEYFQREPCQIGCTFVYALALDPSDEAQARYQAAVKRVRPGAIRAQFKERAVPRMVCDGCKDLAAAVLTRAFFLSEADLPYTRASVLAYSGDHQKALVSVYVNEGALAERWYHVVLRRTGTEWDFVSVVLAAQS